MCFQLQNVKKVCGIKQVKKALKCGIVKKIYFASDADSRLILPVLEHCKTVGIEIVEVSSMKILGEMCGLQVGCSIAAVCQ